MSAESTKKTANLCNLCQKLDNALRDYYAKHRNELQEPWEKKKFALGALDELSKVCICCQDIAASFPAFDTPASPANIFKLVIDDTDIMLKYKVLRNMRSDLYNDTLYLLPAKPISESLEHAKAFDPTWFNSTLAQKWISDCASCHGTACDPPKVPLQDLKSILLIDVVDNCLVASPPDARYIALSYCWGQCETVRALKNNISLLLTHGSLSSQTALFKIPFTIADAIAFVQNIGERYLWVDSLCIVQDDHDKKQQHLKNMAFIYANSFLTLVAAESPNANCGLPGVDRTGRKRHLPLYKIRLPSGTLVLNQPRANLRRDSIWNSRGWTFQESLFSKRMIIFDGYVSWICCCAQWAEDTDRKVARNWPTDQPQQLESNFSVTDRIGLFGRFPIWPDLRIWGSLVEQFNKRDLTFDEDVIHAFAGISAAVRKSFPEGFLFGLPQLYFDLALLWQPERKLCRRKAVSTHLPSWSWVGWKGQVETRMWDICNDLTYNEEYPLPTLSITPMIEWKVKSSPGDQLGHEVPNSYHRYRSTKSLASTNQPMTWTCHSNRDQSHEYYTHETIRGQSFRYPIPISEQRSSLMTHAHSYLSFNAMQACFKIGGLLEDRFLEQERFGTISTYNVAVLDDTNNTIGFLRLNEEDATQAPVGERCELIVISAGSVRIKGIGSGLHSYIWQRDEWALEKWHSSAMKHENARKVEDEVEADEDSEWEDIDDNVYVFYNVLWIERVKGIAYRRALGRTIQDAWDNQKWNMTEIVLG